VAVSPGAARRHLRESGAADLRSLYPAARRARNRPLRGRNDKPSATASQVADTREPAESTDSCRARVRPLRGVELVRGFRHAFRQGLRNDSRTKAAGGVHRLSGAAGPGDSGFEDDHSHRSGQRADAQGQEGSGLAGEASAIRVRTPASSLLMDEPGGTVVWDPEEKTSADRRFRRQTISCRTHLGIRVGLERDRPPIRLDHEVGREDHGEMQDRGSQELATRHSGVGIPIPISWDGY